MFLVHIPRKGLKRILCLKGVEIIDGQLDQKNVMNKLKSNEIK